MFKKYRFSIQHLWALTVIAGVFIFVSTHPIRPQDFWWHIAVGREIVTTGQIPSEDVYSYTMAGSPYPAYKVYWLAEVALYLTYQLGGGVLVVFIHSLLITSAYVIVLYLGYCMSQSWRVSAFVTLFAAALGLNDWNVRPQAITFLLGALLLLSINRFRATRKKEWLILLPVSLAMWTNNHGSFPIGLVLIAAWWLEEVWLFYRKVGGWKEYILVPTFFAFLAGLACFINPSGLRIISYVNSLVGNEVVKNLVPEWAPPSFTTLGGSLFLFGLITSAIIFAVSPKRPTVYQITLFLIFSWLGIKTLRGSIWFGLVLAPVLADRLAALTNHYFPTRQNTSQSIGLPWLNRVFAGGLLLLVIISLPWFKQYLPMPPLKAGIFSYETPIKATEILKTKRLPGPLLHAMSFGSYLIWEAQPEYPVFVDSRIELFDTKIWMEYLYVSNAEGEWQEILDTYGIQTILASPIEQDGLIKALDQSDSWNRVYADDAAVIYTEKEYP